MKSAFIASFLAFLTVCAPSTALAAPSQTTGATRYFVPTTNPFWRKPFGVRHIFKDGFTTDLSGFQLSVAKFAGLRPIPVKNFTILDDAASTPEVTASSTPSTMPSTPQSEPAHPVDWGVAYIHGIHDTFTTTGGKGLKIAILDTGVDREHPDLVRRIAGCADYANPAEAIVGDSCADDNGHGTHVAGIVAADGGENGKGIWGMAPDAELLVYRVCGRSGNCLSDDIAAAVYAAVDADAHIIVLGLGGEATSSFIDDAVAYATDHDVLVVAAAGNDGPYEDSLDWPARNIGVVSVGALASDETVADFSSRGTNSTSEAYRAEDGDLEIVAPGVNIESTFKEGSYAILSGTSMAAAHVAGLAALVWKVDAEHPAQEVRTVLHTMSRDVGDSGDDNASGWGVPRY